MAATLRSQTPERKAYMAAYHAAKRAELSAKAKARYAADPDRFKAKSKAWKEANPERKKELDSQYRKLNRSKLRVQSLAAKKRRQAADPDKFRAQQLINVNRRYANNPGFRLTCVLRARVRTALKGFTKSAKSLELLGCSIEEFRKYLEAQWLPGMSWDNYGKGEGKWEVDHIRACSKFDLTQEDQQRQCFHYSNQQPLWGIDNRRKSNR